MTAAYSIPTDGGDELDFSDVNELPEYLGHVRFRSCRFNSLSFLDTVLDHTVFEDCSLDFTRIGDKIDGCAFLNCSFYYANLLGAQFVGCKMTGSDLSELGESSYSIQGGDWSYTLLSKLKIKKHDLDGVSFASANLYDCSFENCDLRGVRFDNAIVNRVSLRGSDIRGISISGVNIAQLDLKGCIADLEFCAAFAAAHGIKLK